MSRPNTYQLKLPRYTESQVFEGVREWRRIYTMSSFLRNREGIAWSSSQYEVIWNVNTKLQAFYLDNLE